MFLFVISVVFLIILSRVFAGNIILPQFFSVGPITVHYYGLTMALAVAGGFYLAWRRKEKYGISGKTAEDIIFWAIIGGFIGARLYHVLSSLDYYRLHPVDIIKVWNGGLSIYGALIGGLITLAICKKLFAIRYSLLSILDWLTPSLILGQIIGRFGNFFNYELYGYPTNLAWKMFVPLQFRYRGFEQFQFFHPLFLYEALANGVILVLLMKLESKRLHTRSLMSSNYGPRALVQDLPVQQKLSEFSIFNKAGSLFFLALLLYNSVRFLLEYLRIDSVFIGAIRQNAMVSLAFVVISAAVLFRLNKHGKIS